MTGGIALRGVLLQRLGDDDIEILEAFAAAWTAWYALGGMTSERFLCLCPADYRIGYPPGILVDNGTHEWDGRPNGRAGRMLAAEQHVEKDAQRIHIRGRGDRPAGELLWRGILGRQCRTGVTRERARSGRRITPRGVALEQLGDAEVEQFHLTIHADDDVRGLDVTVHDQVGGMRDRLQDVEKQAQAALDPERVLAASTGRCVGRRHARGRDTAGPQATHPHR